VAPVQETRDDADIVVLDGAHASRRHAGHGHTVRGTFRVEARQGCGTPTGAWRRVATASEAVGPLALDAVSGGVSSRPVHNICFHGIGSPRRALEPGEENYWISVEAFLRMLDLLAERPAVRISFDDGNASDVDIALDALRARGLSATFFVVAGRLGEVGSLGRDDLRALDGAGMTIGTHGMDHRSWRGLDAADLERELVDARIQIAEAVGHAIDEAALPLGAYDRRLLGALRQLGYTKVHTSDRRVAREGNWLQPRFSVVATDTPETLENEMLATPARASAYWNRAKNRLKRLR
jgi:peptidoglycan/xylan/chitin deacetylase (PgdA/CDA1 family)